MKRFGNPCVSHLEHSGAGLTVAQEQCDYSRLHPVEGSIEITLDGACKTYMGTTKARSSKK